VAILENRKPVMLDLVKHGKALAETTGDPDVLEKVAYVNQRFDVMEGKSNEKEAFLDKVSRCYLMLLSVIDVIYWKNGDLYIY
jgi:hypothetical protein